MAKDSKLKVNLGSGGDYIPGWVNVDINTEERVDIIADLSKKFPFRDNSVDEIKASDILEHFTKEDGEKFLLECHRVMKLGGKIIIRTHNVLQIFSQFEQDPQVLIQFLYGDTSSTGVFGSHKFGYTKDSLNLVLKKMGFEITYFDKEQTNFLLTAKKIPMPSRTLNIGIIMQSPDMGGAEVFMLSLIDEFLKEGDEIFLSSNKEKFLDHARQYPIKTREIPFILDVIGNYRGLVKSFLLAPVALVFYAKLLFEYKRKDVDVILMSGFSEKLFVSFLSVFFKIPVVWIEYGRLESVFKRNFYIPKVAYRLLSRIPRSIVVPTAHTMKGLITDARVSLAKIKVIPLGIKTPKNFEIKNIKTKNFIIGSVSRLTREKGQDILVKSLPLILKSVPNALLLIIGDGPDMMYYQKLVSDLKLTKQVEITGYVKNPESYYDRMDVFVFPSVWELEGFGLVLAEAMAHRLPIVASNFGPVPEIVQDGKTGILIKAGDDIDLAHAIISLSKSEKVRGEMGEAGFKKFKQKYDIKNSASAISEILYEATIA